MFATNFIEPSKTKSIFQKEAILKDEKIFSDTFKYNFDSLDIELKYER